MRRRDDYEYFEGRAARELDAARSAHDRPSRNIHLKFAKCYHDLARGIAERERMLDRATAPGSLH